MRYTKYILSQNFEPIKNEIIFLHIKHEMLTNYAKILENNIKMAYISIQPAKPQTLEIKSCFAKSTM